jgi:hypothetical protein
MQKEIFNVILQPADFGGCAHYRMKFNYWAVASTKTNIQFIESVKLLPFQQMYVDTRVVRMQRQVNDTQSQYIQNFLMPLSEVHGFWNIYEVDDVLHQDDVPKYNAGWEKYQNPKFANNISNNMNACDFVTVTCDELKNYFINRFKVSKEKLIVIPNYLPYWWFGNLYNEEKIKQRFRSLSTRKPRIGFLTSISHFDVFNQNNGIDDYTHVLDFIRNNVDKYEFYFIGGFPPHLNDLREDKKVYYHGGYDILNYPVAIDGYNFDLVIAPLKDNTFNKCKSNIKFIETAALGIPAICQNLTPYKPYTDLLFNKENDLQDQIDSLLSNEEKYLEVVRANKDILDNGNTIAPNGYWLEKNIHRWVELYTLPRKTTTFDIDKIREIQEKNSKASTELKFER